MDFEAYKVIKEQQEGVIEDLLELLKVANEFLLKRNNYLAKMTLVLLYPHFNTFTFNQQINYLLLQFNNYSISFP